MTLAKSITPFGRTSVILRFTLWATVNSLALNLPRFGEWHSKRPRLGVSGTGSGPTGIPTLQVPRGGVGAPVSVIAWPTTGLRATFVAVRGQPSGRAYATTASANANHDDATEDYRRSCHGDSWLCAKAIRAKTLRLVLALGWPEHQGWGGTPALQSGRISCPRTHHSTIEIP